MMSVSCNIDCLVYGTAWNSLCLIKQLTIGINACKRVFVLKATF